MFRSKIGKRLLEFSNFVKKCLFRVNVAKIVTKWDQIPTWMANHEISGPKWAQMAQMAQIDTFGDMFRSKIGKRLLEFSNFVKKCLFWHNAVKMSQIRPKSPHGWQIMK